MAGRPDRPCLHRSTQRGARSLWSESADLCRVGAGGSLRSQREIAQSLGLDKTTLVVTIDDLERRALVLRKPDPDDRRARILEITAPGVELFAQASEAVRATERNLLAGMSDERIEQTQTALLALLSGPLREYFDRAGSCL
jgi:DNA-binding MarR family transcriptional regulator